VEYTSYRQSVPDRRMMGALRWYLRDEYPASQIRGGTLAPFLLGRYHLHADRVRNREHTAALRSAKIATVGSAVSGLTSLMLWSTLLWLLTTHRMSPVHAGTAVVALQTVSTALWGMVVAGGQLFRTSVFMASWSSYLAEMAAHRLDRGDTVVHQVGSFKVVGASFTYPDAERPALEHIDFEVHAGEVVGLIGMNGSGKSTLGRLLAGLYLPTTGAVLWDGTNTRDLDPMAAWKQLAYMPQQYTKLPVSLRENITQGQPEPGGDDAVMAAARAAGADKAIAKTTQGLDTSMARAFWGGSTNLSGGEWQRVALARVYYRRGSLCLLDEPTAALDAEGEALIVQGLRDQSQGRATVIVTHRLSTLRYVDRVVVLKDGRVAEEGTLAGLLALGGELAYLWSLQQDEPCEQPQDRPLPPAPRSESTPVVAEVEPPVPGSDGTTAAEEESAR
jgi:ATP-binding cassette subfamily B protein